MTRKQKQALRDFVKAERPDIDEVRIGSDGTVRALGPIPHSTSAGWYEYGSAHEILARMNGDTQ